MRRRTFLLGLSAALVPPPSPLLARTRDDPRVARVAAGLRPAVTIAGEPAATMTLADRMRHHKVPGVSIAVIQDGRIAWARGWGVKRAGVAEPVTADTLFQAASISKPVTAVAALRLVEAGRLDLDGNVNKRLKSWRVPDSAFTAGKPVTLRGLLSHGAGVTVHGFEGYAAGSPLPTLIQILDGSPPANSAPIRVDKSHGEGWRYSGGGYTIVQQLIEDATGDSFPAVVRRLVLSPSRMPRSGFWQPLGGPWRAQAALAHGADGQLIAGSWHAYPELAAAGLWSTPSDLARLAVALLRSRARGGLLKPETVEMMLTRQSGDWGLGFGLTGEGRARRFSHSGVNAGYRAYLLAFPETGQGAVVMTNGDGGMPLIQELLRSIAAEYAWPATFQVAKARIAIGAGEARAYAGRYRPDIAPDQIVTMTAEGPRVFARIGAAERFELFAERPDHLFALDGTEFQFRRENGRIKGLNARLPGGVTAAAERLPDTPPALSTDPRS